MPCEIDVSGTGVGGLLIETQSRPSPRNIVSKKEAAIPVAVVLLAAGKASRMGEGGPHKRVATFDGLPLIRRSADLALKSTATSVTIVTEHRRAEIEDAVHDLDVRLIYNPDYASGIAGSLIAGLNVVEACGVLVMLADMPGLAVENLDALITAFRASGGESIVRSSGGGKRGNPLIFPRSLYRDIRRLEGDVGARHLIETSNLPVIDIEIGEGAHLNVDTPEAVISAGGTDEVG